MIGLSKVDRCAWFIRAIPPNNPEAFVVQLAVLAYHERSRKAVARPHESPREELHANQIVFARGSW